MAVLASQRCGPAWTGDRAHVRQKRHVAVGERTRTRFSSTGRSSRQRSSNFVRGALPLELPAISSASQARSRQLPELEANTLFESLLERYRGRYQEGQLRTLERRVKAWRAERGPDKDVVLAQLHALGEAAQTVFTWATELAITIVRQAFVHMLCVFALWFSRHRGVCCYLVMGHMGSAGRSTFPKPCSV
jgi:hypothetical protein